MTAKYPRAYRALKRIGFSPAIALQVLLDAKCRSHPSHSMAMMFLRIARTSGRA